MDYKFEFSTQEKTFKQAQEHCVANGGTLATLDKRKEGLIGDLLKNEDKESPLEPSAENHTT